MRNLSNSQIACITLLWLLLCYLLIKGYHGINTRVVLTLFFSGIIVFAPIYKQVKRRNGKK
ncbi:MAG: hypothetical protein J1E02_04355 [Coprobacter sp.]|nr:hypothetical protein [Coprobacter sp.]